MNWHYEKNGVPFGPVTEAQLEGARLGGEIPATVRVWREDWPAWRFAGDVWPAGPWQDGDSLVVRRKAPLLPDGCLKCGRQPTKRWHKVLKWHHPLLYLTILPFLLPYLVLGLILTRSVKLEIALCSTCGSRRRRNLAIGAILFIAACGCAVAGTTFMTEEDAVSHIFFIAAGVLLVASAVWLAYTRIVSAKRIDRYYAWILKSGPAVRRQLPQWTGG